MFAQEWHPQSTSSPCPLRTSERITASFSSSPASRGRTTIRGSPSTARAMQRSNSGSYPPDGSGLGIERVGREVAVEALLRVGADGDGVDEVFAADEGALPGSAPATERLRAVAAGPRLVNADLEGG